MATNDTPEIGRDRDDYTGRDQRYRIPFDDRRAVRKVHRAEAIGGRILETKTSMADGGYNHMIVQTRDGCGPIDGVPGDYRKSAEWESPFGPGRLENIEIRNASSGGTRVQGQIDVYGRFGTEFTTDIEPFTVGATPSEVKDDPAVLQPLLTEAEAEAARKVHAAQEAAAAEETDS